MIDGGRAVVEACRVGICSDRREAWGLVVITGKTGAAGMVGSPEKRRDSGYRRGVTHESVSLGSLNGSWKWDQKSNGKVIVILLKH
ncbi:hypothetical protein L1887_18093 [Cichorium endivia]|nr:hypothetical protein L1887_18093 [Cichorium endivia]